MQNQLIQTYFSFLLKSLPLWISFDCPELVFDCMLPNSQLLGISRSVITNSTSLLKQMASFFKRIKISNIYWIDFLRIKILVTYSLYKLQAFFYFILMFVWVIQIQIHEFAHQFSQRIATRIRTLSICKCVGCVIWCGSYAGIITNTCRRTRHARRNVSHTK